MDGRFPQGGTFIPNQLLEEKCVGPRNPRKSFASVSVPWYSPLVLGSSSHGRSALSHERQSSPWLD
jgi:hypothetical protein